MEERLDAVDRISQLPEPILQHILSFLPIKEIVRPTILSKRWKEVWDTFPILEFNQTFFDQDLWFNFPDDDEKDKNKQRKRAELFNVVEQIMLARRRQTLSIKKFTLEMCLIDPDSASLIDRWIGHAVDSNIEELKLKIGPWNDRRYNLPQFVLVAKSIAALTLSDCKMESPCIKINLSSLKKLSLFKVYADDHVIQNLVAGCPLVEDMSIHHCFGFKSVHVSGLMKLTKVKVDNNPELELVEIKAPNLYSANFLGHKMPGEINVAHCKNIKSLQINMAASITTKWLQDQLSKLPVLESLVLGACHMLERIKISSPHLNRLVISRCKKLVGVELDTPNLRAFKYTGDVIDFSSNALALSLVELFFDSSNMEISWYAKQIELLAKFNNCSKVVNLRSETGKSLLVPEELRQTVHPPLYKVKKLNLRILALNMTPIEQLVDSLLWISPHSETISIESVTKFSFEFSYNKPIYEQDNLPCCNSFPVSCWRHCIQNFKMEHDIDFAIRKGRPEKYFPKDAEILEKLKGYKDLKP